MADRVEIAPLPDHSVDIFPPSPEIALCPVPGRTSKLGGNKDSLCGQKFLRGKIEKE